MVNRVQVGYPTIMRAITKPKPIEIGLIQFDYKKSATTKKINYLLK